MRHALPLAAAAAIGAVLLWRHIRRSPSLSEEERRVVAALKAVQRRIGSRGVNLIAVSKKKPANLIAAAHGAGQADFGENYVQEVRVCPARRPLATLQGADCHPNHPIADCRKGAATTRLGSLALHRPPTDKQGEGAPPRSKSCVHSYR